MTGMLIRLLIIGKGYTPRKIACLLGISYNEFNSKLDAEKEFNASEIYLLGSLLGIREIGLIFFTKDVD